MAAVATYLGYVLIGSVLAILAAVLRVAACCTQTTAVSAFVIVIRHKISPLIECILPHHDAATVTVFDAEMVCRQYRDYRPVTGVAQ